MLICVRAPAPIRVIRAIRAICAICERFFCVFCDFCVTLKNPFIFPSMKKNELWRFLLQTLISILTAIATALGASSCMG